MQALPAAVYGKRNPQGAMIGTGGSRLAAIRAQRRYLLASTIATMDGAIYLALLSYDRTYAIEEVSAAKSLIAGSLRVEGYPGLADAVFNGPEYHNALAPGPPAADTTPWWARAPPDPAGPAQPALPLGPPPAAPQPPPGIAPRPSSPRGSTIQVDAQGAPPPSPRLALLAHDQGAPAAPEAPESLVPEPPGAPQDVSPPGVREAVAAWMNAAQQDAVDILAQLSASRPLPPSLGADPAAAPPPPSPNLDQTTPPSHHLPAGSALQPALTAVAADTTAADQGTAEAYQAAPAVTLPQAGGATSQPLSEETGMDTTTETAAERLAVSTAAAAKAQQKEEGVVAPNPNKSAPNAPPPRTHPYPVGAHVGMEVPRKDPPRGPPVPAPNPLYEPPLKSPPPQRTPVPVPHIPSSPPAQPAARADPALASVAAMQATALPAVPASATPQSCLPQSAPLPQDQDQALVPQDALQSPPDGPAPPPPAPDQDLAPVSLLSECPLAPPFSPMDAPQGVCAIQQGQTPVAVAAWDEQTETWVIWLPGLQRVSLPCRVQLLPAAIGQMAAAPVYARHAHLRPNRDPPPEPGAPLSDPTRRTVSTALPARELDPVQRPAHGGAGQCPCMSGHVSWALTVAANRGGPALPSQWLA